jgi:hypothetical protein
MTGLQPSSPMRLINLAIPGLATWLVFFLVWAAILLLESTPIAKLAVVDSHFTTHPEKYPQYFQTTDWRSTPCNSLPFENLPAETKTVLTRTATYPLTLLTIRYSQLSQDDGETAETYRYDVDIRWGATVVAIVASGIALFPIHLAIRLFRRGFARKT